MAALVQEVHMPCAHQVHTAGSQREVEGLGNSNHLGGKDHGDRLQDASDLDSILADQEADKLASEDRLGGTAVGGDDPLLGEVLDGHAADSRLVLHEVVRSEGLGRSPGPRLH